MNPLEPVLEQVDKLWSAVGEKASIRLGTVTQVSPLLVALDGDIDSNGAPVTAPAQSLSTHTVGQRVICAEQYRRLLIIQAA